MRYLILVLLFGVISTTYSQNYYAVIISGHKVTKTAPSGENAYWNDSYIMKKYLLEDGGFDDVWFLYADGDDIRTIEEDYDDYYYTTNYVDYSATPSNVETIFDKLSTGGSMGGQTIPEMDETDVLFVFINNHGAHTTGCDAYIQLYGGTMDDSGLASYIDQINCKKRIIVMTSCYSGGFKDDLENTSTIFISSASCMEDSKYADNNAPDGDDNLENEIRDGDTYYHTELGYHFINAIREETFQENTVDSDDNSDGYISITEAFNFSDDKNSTNSTFQYSSLGNIGSHTFLNVQEDKQWDHYGRIF